MAKQKWTYDEECVLVRIYFRNEEEAPLFYLVNLAFDELLKYNNHDPHPHKAIRAKFYDIIKIDRGLDISHVAKTTIRAYLDYPEKPENPLYSLVEKLNQSKLEIKVVDSLPSSHLNNYLSADNPFRNTTAPIVNVERPEKDFYAYLEEIIEELHDFDNLSWSTIYKNAEINHTTANDLRCGNQKMNSDYLFRLLIAMRLPEKKKAISLMMKAGISFKPNTEPDTIVKIAILNNYYNRIHINEYLIDKGKRPLFPKLAKRLQQI